MLYQEHEQKAFVGWMREHGHMFTGEEYHARFGIWMTNKRYVQTHNKANGGFVLALNRFAHMTPSEYKAILGFDNKMIRKMKSRPSLSNSQPAESIDWRQKNVVNEVKDQANCGSCWTFSTIQSVESAYAIKHGKLLSLSEQNLVDCVTSCDGCNGGLMDKALDYVIEHQGGRFMTEADYPYTAHDGKCKFDASKAAEPKVTSYINIVEGSESDLEAKVSTFGPAAIAIDASHYTFQMYSRGIYDEKSCSSSALDHAVGCVGYGSENGVKYWIVRNSWGTSWGENGYIRMIRGRDNQCGIASMALIPTLD